MAILLATQPLQKQRARPEPPMGSRSKAVFKAYWHEVVDIEPNAIFMDPIYMYKTKDGILALDIIQDI